MNFDYTPKVRELQARLIAFMAARVYPNERRYRDEVEGNRAQGNPWIPTRIVEELKVEARAAGLWNLFLPQSARGAGLTNLEYAPLAEIMGRVTWAPEVFNCNAPDTGNMETIERYGTPEQKRQWLEPLLAGEIRSAFLMTEPAVASSDATNIECRMVRDGDQYVDQRPQVVVVGCGRSALPDLHRDGQDRSRRAEASPAVDAAGARGRARGEGRPAAHRPQCRRRAARAHGNRPRRRARAGDQPAEGRGLRLRDRAGRASDPAASTTACASSASPSARSS